MRAIQINFDFVAPKIHIKGADFWSCNGLHVLTEPYGIEPTGWFQVHRPEDIVKERPEHQEWLISHHEFPIWTHPETVGKAVIGEYAIPAAVSLPMTELDALWTWPFEVGYGSTFSYQIAMAIHMGYDMIDIRDVKLTDVRERAIEVPNFLLWVGEAHKRGIDVILSQELSHPFKYGQAERLTDLPGWLPLQVVNDMFPGWSYETRRLFDLYKRNVSEWEVKRAERYNEAQKRRIQPVRIPLLDNS